jgi:HPt (histidine-containing phosphotransfer) domain-containing protein
VVQFDDDGQPFTYQLSELATWLGVERKPLHPVVRRAFEADPQRRGSDAQRERNRRGWRALRDYYVRDFQVLLAMRGGGFDRGIRNRGAFYHALFLRKLGASEAEIHQQLAEYARRCRPALNSHEVLKAIREGCRATRFPTYAKICADLQIAPEEQAYLEKFRATTSQVERASDRSSRAAQTRREAIQAWVAQHPRQALPSCRDMQAHLAGLGIVASHVAVFHDYRSLGLRSAGTAGRPRAARLPLPDNPQAA